MQRVILGILLIVVFGCHQEIDEFEVLNDRPVTFPEVLDLPVQTFAIDNQVAQSLDLGDGFIADIAPNSFLDDQQQVVSGQVDIQFTLIEKKSDLIFAYLNSNSNTGPFLNMNGCFRIKAYANQKAVHIAPNNSISVRSPMNADFLPDDLWVGAPDNSFFGWSNTSSDGQFEAANWSSNGENYHGIKIWTNQLGWQTGGEAILGDKTLCLNIPKEVNIKKTRAFFVLDNHMTVAELTPDLLHHQFCLGDIPEASSGTIVILHQESDSGFQFFEQSITILQDESIPVTLAQRELDSIIRFLNEL